MRTVNLPFTPQEFLERSTAEFVEMLGDRPMCECPTCGRSHWKLANTATAQRSPAPTPEVAELRQRALDISMPHSPGQSLAASKALFAAADALVAAEARVRKLEQRIEELENAKG